MPRSFPSESQPGLESTAERFRYAAKKESAGRSDQSRLSPPTTDRSSGVASTTTPPLAKRGKQPSPVVRDFRAKAALRGVVAQHWQEVNAGE